MVIIYDSFIFDFWVKDSLIFKSTFVSKGLLLTYNISQATQLYFIVHPPPFCFYKPKRINIKYIVYKDNQPGYISNRKRHECKLDHEDCYTNPINHQHGFNL